MTTDTDPADLQHLLRQARRVNTCAVIMACVIILASVAALVAALVGSGGH